MLETIRYFYTNPYGITTTSYVATNLQSFIHTPTLLYFAVLLIGIGIARYCITRYTDADSHHLLLYDFTIIYSILAFIYYLRSPGWLRYIIIAEFLILLILPHATSLLFSRYAPSISWKKMWGIF